MKIILAFILISFVMCTSNELPAQNFSGSFKGEQPNLISSAELKVTNKQLGGTILINGRPGTVKGTVADSVSNGMVHDIQMNKDYAYTSVLSGNELRFSITFPELNNQVVVLVMKRGAVAAKPSTTAGASKTPAAGNRNPALVGVWRHTEVLSSGSGSNYASFSTSYYMEFRADGTALSWKGKSAGGGSGVSLESGAGNADKGEWTTEGKTLYLTDGVTGQKASMLFYAEANRMMLHNGGKEKKIFERVR